MEGNIELGVLLKSDYWFRFLGIAQGKIAFAGG